jgi:hypothetical protein
MTRALVAVGALLALAFLILGVAVFATRDEDRITADNLLSEDLTRAIGVSEEQTRGEVDLRTVADFPWDRVLVVARGAPRDDVASALGSDYNGTLPFGSRGPVFVFARGSAVARIADYRGRATFRGFEAPVDELPRDRSLLRVDNLVVSPAS